MFKFVKALLLLAALCVFGAQAYAITFEGAVLSCEAGEMIEVENRKAVEKIYFYDINITDKTKAAAFLKSVALNKKVKVEVIGNRKGQGKFGDVTLPDGRDLQYIMVENGLAQVKDISNAKRRNLKKAEPLNANPEPSAVKQEPSAVPKQDAPSSVKTQEAGASAEVKKQETPAKVSSDTQKQQESSPADGKSEHSKTVWQLIKEFVKSMYEAMNKLFSSLASKFSKK